MIQTYDDLEYEDLKHLAGEYNNYIQEFDYASSGEPVSIYEFYDYEYQEILKDNDE